MYTGDTFVIPMDKGGLTGNPNANGLPAEMMTEARNIDINTGERASRGGTSHVNASAISGTPRIMNFFDFILKNGNQFQVIVTNAGEILKNPTTAIKTGWSINNPAAFEVFLEKLYICGGTSIPQIWDGSASDTVDLVNPAADWGIDNYPKQIIKHGRKNSERLWAIGASDNPFSIYVSENGSDDFAGGTSQRIDIHTKKGSGLLGGIEFGDRIIFFSEERAYIIDDTSITTSDWGYAEAQWKSGAANHRLIVETPNDIVVMTGNGEIYSFGAVQSYGDYTSASLLKPDDIQVWIKDHINLTRIDQFHGVYDPTERRVLFFMVSNTNSQVDTTLIYYIDTRRWVVHDALDNPADSGYNASCSAVIQESVGNFRIHTGDYKGFLWRLDNDSNNDNGNGYYSGWTTPPINFDNIRVRKKVKRGRMISVGKGDWDVNIKWAVDEDQKTDRTVNQFGSGFLLDDPVHGLLDTSSMGSDNPQIDKLFQLEAIGKNVVLEVYNDTVDEDFAIKTLMIDYRQLGVKP